ncbi:prolyl 4-hydroxylase subunit alpha-1-like [Macrobrachium nipponense]|uniref:prolyl 4-hydroxylase subunit alpha-1-like n=1 Tax=Macrobrachium nipponense TaxID=159736 RepID=UPI0030C88FA8
MARLAILLLTATWLIIRRSSGSEGTCNETTKIRITHPDILRFLTPEQLETGRALPSSPPMGMSMFHLSRLARDEIQVAKKLKELEALLHRVTHVLKRYSMSWSELSEADVGTEGWAEHPLHAYALTKHVALGWPDVEEALSLLQGKTTVVDDLLKRRNTTGVPTAEDLTSVAGGLARVHDFYSLDLNAISQAHLRSRLSPLPVPAKIMPSVWDLYRIGKEAIRINIWSSGVDFLRTALDRYNATLSRPSCVSSSDHTSPMCSSFDMKGHPFDKRDEMSRLPDEFKKAVKMHDQVLERKGFRTKNHSTHQKPLDKHLARKRKYHKKQETIVGEVGTHTEGQVQYVRLCRGEDLRATNATSDLYCRYLSNGSPLYIIGPLKMEVHSLSPYIVTIEGVVTSSEAKAFKQTASVLLEKSSTFRYNGESEVSYQRTSSTAWLYEHNSKYLPLLTGRIEGLTGMNCQQYVAAETYQVVNYGVGGHYTVHHDATASSLPFNRMATFLIYLTDVQQGGATVFPWLGFGVRPRQGMGLLWYNLSPAGERDDRLEHAACPVLFGDKWIINKWITYGGQFTRIPCTTSEEDYVKQPLA